VRDASIGAGERHGQDERRRPAGGYERQYRELAAQIADVGIIASGSVTRRYTRCTSPGCRCNADPPRRTALLAVDAKVDGKTVTRRLTAERPRSTRSGSATIDASELY